MIVCLTVSLGIMLGTAWLAHGLFRQAPERPSEDTYVGRHIRMGQPGVYVPGWSLQRVVRHRVRGGFWDMATAVAGEWAPGDLIHA